MKTIKNLRIAASLSIILTVSFSCQPETNYPPVPGGKYQMVVDDQLTYSKVECCKAGNSCVQQGINWYDYSGFFAPIRTYIEDDRIADFFLNENWQSYFPELIPYPEAIEYIIRHNPKVYLSEEGSVIIMKEKNMALTTEDIYIGFKATEPCDKETVSRGAN